MRSSILLLPIALTTLASMPIAAQEAPRVIFCSGQCTAVDEKGVRTPAPKGTQLQDGQRLETGPGAYAQLKLGQDVALGVSERAQVRFDQKSVRDRDLVILDQGRVRMLDGAATGKPANRAVQMRTTDGSFALRGADIEVRTRAPAASGGSSLTVVKLNGGDARLLSPQGDTMITRDGVQGFTAGKATTDKSLSIADISTTPSRDNVRTPAPAAEPVRNLPAARTSLPAQILLGKNDLIPGPSLPLPGPRFAPPPPTPRMPAPVPKADQLLATPIIVLDPTTLTFTTTTLTKLVTSEPVIAPTTTTTTTTKTLTQFTLTPTTTTTTITKTPLLTTIAR